MFQLRAEEVVRGEESMAGRELAWERWAEKTCFFEKGTESNISELEMREIELEVPEQTGQPGLWEPG